MGLVGVVIVRGILLSQYWYYLPGIVSDFVSPIGENQAIVWDQDPTEPGAEGGEVERLRIMAGLFEQSAEYQNRSNGY